MKLKSKPPKKQVSTTRYVIYSAILKNKNYLHLMVEAKNGVADGGRVRKAKM